MEEIDQELDALRIQQAHHFVRIRKRGIECYGEQWDSQKNYIYVLELQGGMIYVGRTENIYMRLYCHLHCQEMSSQWVRMNHPVKQVIEIIRDCNVEDEKDVTLEWMSKLGWERVRGSYWVKNTLRGPPRSLDSFRRTRTYKYMTRQEIDMILKVVDSLLD